MALEVNTIESKITNKFEEGVSNFRMENDIFTFEATPDVVKEVIRYMHENEKVLRFNFLTDICGVHYPDNEPSAQFVVVYHLHNWIDNRRVRIKTYLNGDKPEVDTISDIFSAANWMERETFDFFGINFIGHPNMKRILNVDSMTTHPMRKEYPLEDAGRTDKDDRFFGRTTNNYQVK